MDNRIDSDSISITRVCGEESIRGLVPFLIVYWVDNFINQVEVTLLTPPLRSHKDAKDEECQLKCPVIRA